MNRAEAWDLLSATSLALVDDPSSDVVNAEEFEGRWAVRLRQEARDYTTVWFEVGDLTVGFEAYVLPNPPLRHQEIYRQLLTRNHRMWRAHFSIDKDGDLFLVGRVSLDEWTEGALDTVLGTIYEAVELSFKSLIRIGFQK